MRSVKQEVVDGCRKEDKKRRDLPGPTAVGAWALTIANRAGQLWAGVFGRGRATRGRGWP